jgi:hypothetical protein
MMDELDKAATVIGWEALARLFHGVMTEAWPVYTAEVLSQIQEQSEKRGRTSGSAQDISHAFISIDGKRGRPVKRDFEWWLKVEKRIEEGRSRDKYGAEAHIIARYLTELYGKPVRASRVAKDRAVKTIQNALATCRKRAIKRKWHERKLTNPFEVALEDIPPDCEIIDDPRLYE